MQSEVSFLVLQELPAERGLEWALQLALLGHHPLLPALALLSQRLVGGLADPGPGKGTVMWGGRGVAELTAAWRIPPRLTWTNGTTRVCRGISINTISSNQSRTDHIPLSSWF